MSAKPISVAEAASRLGVNQARVRAMIVAGLLDAVKVGGRWLIDGVRIMLYRWAGRSALTRPGGCSCWLRASGRTGCHPGTYRGFVASCVSRSW
ncbi:MAG: helix-turn-helix domain-containing protein [Deltaproteobacteria bacterium]|nr:helix-turn-helix domain-containing protein [Deltaproteobacteria bacterium]